MKTMISLILFSMTCTLLWSQELVVVNEKNEALTDCLIVGSNGIVAENPAEKNRYSIAKLSFPISIHSYGYNSFRIYKAKEISTPTVLIRLSDSLASVDVLAPKISPLEALKKILENTGNSYRPPDTLMQEFTYSLQDSTGKTIAKANGIVSRDIYSDWYNSTHIESIFQIYLDSTRQETLANMWPSPFVHCGRKTYVPNYINNLEKTYRNTLSVELDSVINLGPTLKYYFSGTTTYKSIFFRKYVRKFKFVAQGQSLKNAILESMSLEHDFDNMGLKSHDFFQYDFSTELNHFAQESYILNHTADDKKCPRCLEELRLFKVRSDLQTNSKRFIIGFLNLWQFNDTVRRDSILPYLLVDRKDQFDSQ